MLSVVTGDVLGKKNNTDVPNSQHTDTTAHGVDHAPRWTAESGKLPRTNSSFMRMGRP